MGVGGVHDDARRLVEREQMVVFVDDVERDVFGRHRPACGVSWRGREHHGHDVAERGAGRDTVDGRAVHADHAVLDPRLHARARGGFDAGEMAAQHEIEAPPGVATVRGERVEGHGTLFTVCLHLLWGFRLQAEVPRATLPAEAGSHEKKFVASAFRRKFHT